MKSHQRSLLTTLVLISGILVGPALGETFRGRISEVILDRTNETSEARKTIRTKDGVFFITGKVPETGGVVELHGTRSNSHIVSQKFTSMAVQAQRPLSDLHAGIERMLVVRLAFDGGDVTPCSEDQARRLVFDHAEKNSLRNFVYEMSKGKVDLTGNVHPGLISVAASPSACETLAWSNQAEEKLRLQGIDPGSYTRIMYFAPLATCDIAGSAEPNGPRSWLIGGYCAWKGILAHEYGHNLGLGHATTPGTSYGDQSDVQGMSRYEFVGFNAPHHNRLGWLGPEEVLTATDDGVEHWLSPLYPTAKPTPYPKFLKARLPSMADDLFLSLRRPIGYDQSLYPQYLDGVAFHTMGREGTPPTVLHRMIKAGESQWLEEQGLQIDVLQVEPDRAKVKLSRPCYRRPFELSNLRGPYLIAPNGTLDLELSVANGDSLGCTQTDYTWSVSSDKGVLPAITPTVNTLRPKETGAAILRMVAQGLSEDASPLVRFRVTSPNHVPQEKSLYLSVDGTAPLVPTSLVASTSKVCRAVALTWNHDPALETFPVRFKVYRNGSLIGVAEEGLAYQDVNVPVGVHSYSVQAVDSVGNASELTEPSSVVVRLQFGRTCPR